MKGLRARYGGFPLWAWLGLAGLGAWFLFPRLGSSSQPGGASAAPVELSSGVMMVGYIPGGAGFSGSPALAAGAGLGQTASQLRSQRSAGLPAAGADTVPSRSSPLSPAPVSDTYSTGQGYEPQPALAITPTSWGLNPQPQPPPALSITPTRWGGPAPSIGSRRAETMSSHHPDLKRSPRLPYVVQAVGGPSQHSAHVHRIAHAAGVHPARLLALNPVPTGLIHVR